jgi:hypothetical protein
MSIEKRVEELEKLTLDQAHELMAIDILLRSIILSHPNPEKLGKAIEAASSNFADQAMEHGFLVGHKPSTAGAITTTVDAQLKKWLAIVPR